MASNSLPGEPIIKVVVEPIPILTPLWNGYEEKTSSGQVSSIKKLNFNYSTGQVRVYLKLYQKALASLARWSIDTRVLKMCLLQHQQFFSIFIIWGAQNQSTLSLRLRSTTVVYIAWHESLETVSFGLMTWRYVVTRFILCDIASLASLEQATHLFRIKVYKT